METGSASLEPFLAAPRKMRVPAQVVPVGGNSATLSEGKLLVLVDSRDTACPLFSVRDNNFFFVLLGNAVVFPGSDSSRRTPRQEDPLGRF